MADAHILIVEDDRDQRELLQGILRSAKYQVTSAASAEEALMSLGRAPIDLVLSDYKLPGIDGTQLLALVKRRNESTAFVMITAYGTIAHAVTAIRDGADDYLPKPFEKQSLLLAVERTLRSRRLLDENKRLTEELTDRDRLVDLLGRAKSMQQLYREVEKVADSDATVAITGESGTGKELAARALHCLSRRKDAPFIAVNCAAIPEGLIEAEFFGALKGSYSGATHDRVGRFEAAQGGTIFLDEVTELPLELQAKLLRVLQEKRFTPVGAVDEKSADVRIVSASNRDLEQAVKSGQLREDLFYRLNVVPLHMPPLRERREDIPMLIEHFTERAARRHGRPKPRFTSAVSRRLFDHPWPGNVRELENAIERLVLLANGESVATEDLPADFEVEAHGAGNFELPPTGIAWEEHERQVLRQALELARGNRTRAAKLLHMPYKAFLYRLEKHGLNQPA